MPKMFVHAAEGTFSSGSRAEIAAALTDLGMGCERLADTEAVRGGVWVLFSDHAPDSVFHGGAPATKPIIALVVYALRGGLDEGARKKLISGATDILKAGVQAARDEAAIYVVIQETPENDWGMYGRQVSLSTLRTTD